MEVIMITIKIMIIWHFADQKAGWQRWYWRIEKHLTSVPSQQIIALVQWSSWIFVIISYIFLCWQWLKNNVMTIASQTIGDNTDEYDREFPCVAYSSPTILSQYILHIWNKSSWNKSQISQVLKKVKSQSSRANWLLATGHHLPAVQCTQVCISPTCHPGALAQLCSSFSCYIFFFPVVFNSFYYSAAIQW